MHTHMKHRTGAQIRKLARILQGLGYESGARHAGDDDHVRHVRARVQLYAGRPGVMGVCSGEHSGDECHRWRTRERNPKSN